MSQENLIKMQCKNCRRINYWTHKDKRRVERKIELQKYCKWCRQHTTHKEAKK